MSSSLSLGPESGEANEEINWVREKMGKKMKGEGEEVIEEDVQSMLGGFRYKYGSILKMTIRFMRIWETL